GVVVHMDGQGEGISIGRFVIGFELSGISIDYDREPVEIGGGFLKQTYLVDGQPITEYDGNALIKTETFALAAIGSYAEINGATSMFIYAVLDYPLGGPSFFFITGLAAGFGYNRRLVMPTIDAVDQFPLVAEAMSASLGQSPPPPPAGQPALMATMEKMHTYIPPQIGENFLAVGIHFTSFGLIDSFVLLTVMFGTHVEIDILGISTVVVPKGAGDDALAVVQLALMARINPDDGFFSLQADLLPSSYIFSHKCHLTGGFAMFSWFDPSPHSGDFVLTLGGYHPEFNVPSHYPSVPRLGFNWQVSDQITISGHAYYALTSSALMAGGNLSAVWQDGSLSASFNAGADFLISWKPYFYKADFHISIEVSYTYHFFGTHHIDVGLGVDLNIWGPDFSGTARVHLWIVSFTVGFGSSTLTLQPILWSEFHASFLPAPEKTCAISVTGGLIKALQNASVDSLVNPRDLRLQIHSAVPIKMVTFDGVTHTYREGWNDDFGIAPMDLAHDAIDSVMEITVEHLKGEDIHGSI
ncbi:MAG: hypothetical protein IH587_00640, partial [Anaerolineae bacterium]|nr:hypothetical protein [Anaerolineae bacterium]